MLYIVKIASDFFVWIPTELVVGIIKQLNSKRFFSDLPQFASKQFGESFCYNNLPLNPQYKGKERRETIDGFKTALMEYIKTAHMEYIKTALMEYIKTAPIEYAYQIVWRYQSI